MTRAASLYVTVACLALSEQCDSVEALHHNDRLLVVQRTLQRGGACRRSKQRPSLVQVAAPLAEDCDVAVRALFKHNRGYSSARRSRFGATSGRRISDSVNALLKSPTSVVLLRGGAAATMDATSMATSLNRILKVLLTRSTVAKYIACYWMVQGLRSGINSVRFWERNGSLKLRSEDLAAWAGEVIGYVLFGLSNQSIFL
jgi:hypothetical protein